MQSVRILIPRKTEYRAGDAFDVFGNGGSGAIDFLNPLTSRKLMLWPESAERRGHLLDGHLTMKHLDGIRPDGHLDGIHLNDRFLMPAGARLVEVGRYVFGRFDHAVRLYDRFGNTHVQTPVTLSTVINSSPSAPERLTAQSHDAGSDQMTFSFEPSLKLVG